MGSGNVVPDDLREALHSRPLTMPCRLLYDSLGSQLYSEITELPEYTPYRAELGLLKSQGRAIEAHLPPGSLLVELGCGDATKTRFLLNSLLDTRADLQYVGIDVSAEALRQTGQTLSQGCPRLPTSALHLVEGEYLDALRRVRQDHPGTTLCVLWLGSSVGNFVEGKAEEYLGALAAAAGPDSRLLLGTDDWKSPALLHAAYHDSEGITEQFIINGVKNMLRTLGHPDAEADDLWEYRVHVNGDLQRVEMSVISKRNVKNIIPGVSLAPGDELLVEISRKFTQASLGKLAMESGLAIQEQWRVPGYSLTLLVPSLSSLRSAWDDTDSIFEIIRDWAAQPIGLRNPFSFYYGHMASFARTRLLPDKEALEFDTMYSRGIDPNVSDPSICHGHPPAPPAWPSKERVREYVDAVREELLSAPGLNTRVIQMVVEHERMHQETLCYMLCKQRRSDWVCTGGGLPALRAEKLGVYVARAAAEGKASGVKNKSLAVDLAMIRIAGGQVKLGIDPRKDHGFVWDNELGLEKLANLPGFFISSWPVTVEQFKQFVEAAKPYETEKYWNPKDWAYISRAGWSMPANWVLKEGSMDKDLHIVYAEGLFHWTQVAKRPAFVSLAEAEAYCRWAGGRIMSEAEYQLCMMHNERSSLDPESDSIHRLEKDGWEWTCTPFHGFKGFKPDPLYPEYSTDFFDGKHFVLKGSSPYTHPSMRRSSFRNFYQRLYPYVPAKFHVVKDIAEE